MENGNESLWYIPGVCSGLTKREYFAAMAMQGILANEQLRYSVCRPGRMGIGKYAIEQADALLQELDQNKLPTSHL